MQRSLPRPGELLWIRGRRWRVAAVRGDSHAARLDVTGHSGRLTFLFPFDQPVVESRSTRPVRARRQQTLARLSGLCGATFQVRTAASAVAADAAILPHQLEPALAALSGCRRMLIADEVGLGKTIQAGLIAAEILRRDPSVRILVTVPAALVEQWVGELTTRFGMTCLVADRAGLEARARVGAFGDSPWRAAGTWIASFDFLKQPHVVEAMPARPWDLLVIDEAHTACGLSDRHAVASSLGRRARAVVLLTATPHSGDEDRFQRLLSIGRLADDELLVFRRRRRDLGIVPRRRVAWHNLSLAEPEVRALAALSAFDRAVLHAAGPEGRNRARLLLSVLRKRALSTMGALGRTIARRLAWLEQERLPVDPWTQGIFDFGHERADDVESAGDRDGLTSSSGLSPDVERSWLTRLAHLAEVASSSESKVARLARLLERTSEPAIVFTEFRHSLEVVRERVRGIRRTAELHGGLTPAERVGALEAFERGSASVLLATDVAGQGLNLQARCRWVVSLELPWNPARLEQRIGRVDRIGQRRPVHLTLLVARHGAETGILTHLAKRVLAARRPLGDAALIDIPPSEAEIHEAVVQRTPLALTPAPAPTLQLCRRWERPARASARLLAAQRARLRRWRGSDTPGRPVWIELRRVPVIAAATGGDPLLIFSVPFMDRAGAIAERHVVAVRVEGTTRPWVEAARDAALQ